MSLIFALVFLPQIQKYIISFSKQGLEVFKNMLHFFVADSKFQSLGPREKTGNLVCFGTQDITLYEFSLTKSCRITMRYFWKIVSKSCMHIVSFCFKRKSQYLINVKFVNIQNFHFFHFFSCIPCRINYSNGLSLFACEFFQFCFSGTSPGNIPII